MSHTAQRLLPWVLLLIFLAYLVRPAMPPKDSGAMHLQRAATLPVTGDGRVKPLDTVARVNLMLISGRQTAQIKDAAAGAGTYQSVPAIQWLLDVMNDTEAAGNYEVFLITHPDVLGLMGMRQTEQKRFSFNQLRDHAVQIEEQMTQALQVEDEDQRTAYQAQLVELAGNIHRYNELQMGQAPYAVPPLKPGEQWKPLIQAVSELHQTGGKGSDAAQKLTNLMVAYKDGDATRFNSELAGYQAMLETAMPQAMTKSRLEVFYNHFEPFYQGIILYMTAFVLGCVSFLVGCFALRGWARSLRMSALTLILLAFVIQTAAIVARIYLQGRPPVTNLYSSAVFIGWACVPLALGVEYFFRMGLALIVAALAGFATLIIAHNLVAVEGDTMKNLQAVLDTNFWLATHVPTVTLGYAATFLAGLLAITFILLGVFTPLLTKTVVRDFGRAVYGVICFAMLLSFVGTILGGIWADQSWGRFWGWDPKENGAVLIVLINVLILHARWGGLVRERGMMVLAVVGNIVTAWSWFGTNMLGIGFHSYGFMHGARLVLIAFIISQLVIIALGCLPMRAWLSFNQPAHQGPPPVPSLPNAPDAPGKGKNKSTGRFKPARA